MPDLTAQAATFRSGRFSFTGYIGNIPQTVVFSRAVNMATITYPVTTITFDDPYTGTGSNTDVVEGMLVRVYDQNTSTVKGYLRVADGGASSTVLQVNEFSKTTLDLTDNDKFEVIESYLLWDKLVAATANFEKDSRVTFTDQTDNYPPVANGGGAWFGFVDSGAAVATIDFDWTTSFAVDPDNVSGLTYVYDNGDGTITSGTTTSSTNTTTFPVGFRHVSLAVTDADNAQSMTKQIPVRVYDADNPPLAVQMESLSADVQTGWRATFRLPKGSEADIANLPDGAFICYFDQERYGATQASYGANTPTDRSHIKFTGYLVRDSIRITPEDPNEVTFEAVGPMGILEQLGALPQLMISDASPARWQELKTLTVRRALWYLIYWHSTALEYFDFLWPAIQSAFTYTRLAVEDTSSIAGQMRDLAMALNLDVTCDRVGRLALKENPNYLSVSDRGSVTTTYNITTADLMSADIDREHRHVTKLVEADGITTSDNPVFAKSGVAPGQGAGIEALSRQVVSTQAQLNQRCGDHYARVNGLYYNETSKAIDFVPRNVRVRVPDGYDVFDPAHREFITLTLASSTNGRGVAFTTSTKWTIERVDVSYDPDRLTKDIDLTLNHETHGPAGVTHVPPQTSSNNLGAFPSFDLQWPDFGDFTFEFPGWNTGLNPAIGTLAAFARDSKVYFTTEAADFSTPSASGGPVWTATDLTALSPTALSGTLLSFVVDAFSPGYTGTTNGAINGRIVTSTGIYRVTDIFSQGSGIALSLQHTFTRGATDLEGRYIDASFGFQNQVAVASMYRGATNTLVEWTYTTDGSTWNEVTVTSFGGQNDIGQYAPGLHISSRTSGLCYVAGYVATDDARLYKSTDSGATWAQVSPAIDLTRNGTPTAGTRALHATIHVPFDDNNDTLFWGSCNNASGGSVPGQQDLAYAVIGSTTETYIRPEVGAGPGMFQRSMASLGSNRQTMAFISGQNNDLWTTTTGGATAGAWTQQQDAMTGYASLALVGEATSQTMYIWGLNRIGYSEDLGATIDDRTGNLVTGLSMNSYIVNICGKGS